MDQLVLQPISKIEGHVKLPGSKSLSNRILLLAALSKGTTVVKNLLVRPDPVRNSHTSPVPHMPCLPRSLAEGIFLEMMLFSPSSNQP